MEIVEKYDNLVDYLVNYFTECYKNRNENIKDIEVCFDLTLIKLKKAGFYSYAFNDKNELIACSIDLDIDKNILQDDIVKYYTKIEKIVQNKIPKKILYERS